ncbi:hypothetical protein EG68_06190 [Paragonimus skrjabini miyazakii]|uniref:Uncharacterized protein n=1 Tax=Paragonimus skrjabini miyazakii TaxID=59628 RepID=A0A8S9YV40_9TREM|nr:hypothetical protein EG68_06190 [Paragonimus skrjabini miyazakii]
MSVAVKVTEGVPRSVCTRMFNCAQVCRPASMNRILSAAEKRSRYFRRLVNFKHMDFEYALWQMLQLIVAPQRLFRNFKYRNCSRRQWARDDPAFLVLVFILVIVVNSILASFSSPSVWEQVKFVIWVAVFDFFALALIAATFFWIIANRFLVDRSRVALNANELLSTSSELQTVNDVEWAYAFDIHLNAIFPSVLIDLVHLPLFFFILSNSFVGRFIGNSLWLVAAIYYNYITFLGYSALPFLKRTSALLWPITASVIIFTLSLALGWNFTVFLWQFHQFRL